MPEACTICPHILTVRPSNGGGFDSFCMCACTDNTFNLYDGEGVGDKIEPNGHITRVNPKDAAGWCRQAFTDADSYVTDCFPCSCCQCYLFVYVCVCV